ncbi:MAG TPA: class I SAM-dependent methyltransferase [Candidatus Limnocylindrales bacterium]|nr:class I SAM-dependent methyltransferase [Candidatus Limnocylindrales bacterium]
MSAATAPTWPAPQHGGALGWDDPRTAEAYAAFDASYGRYAAASRAVVRHARIRRSDRVLDLGAGIGGTTHAVLTRLNGDGRVVCVEPARAMRAAGESRVLDPRVRWLATLPAADAAFDRIVCSAAIWLLQPLGQTFAMLARALAPGGLLSFNVPALYLGEPDAPGGGTDPLLLRLPAEIAAGHTFDGQERIRGRLPCDPTPVPADVASVESTLATAGFRSRRWRFRVRLTQPMLRDWMKIPVVTDPLLAPLAPAARNAIIDAAYERCDPASWRWERWIGWTAQR